MDEKAPVSGGLPIADSQVENCPLKPIHSLVIDTGPLIKNDPPISALRARSETLYTIPSVISEIRDPATRSRVETTLLPFLTVRAPKPESIKFITGFARRTGDLTVLSKPDIEILALGYELECERNGGDWRLRNTPGQKVLNGRPTQTTTASNSLESTREVTDTKKEETANVEVEKPSLGDSVIKPDNEDEATVAAAQSLAQVNLDGSATEEQLTQEASATDSTATIPQVETTEINTEEPQADAASDSDEDGWITASNLKKQQEQDARASVPTKPVTKTLQAAILTSDFAMQNVALRMNLNLVTPSFARITYLKTWVLRCYGCFHVTKEMERQFCPSCGQPTLTRTSCSTDEHGVFKIHLKKNFQWNKRGNVYSVPKPVHGTANGRLPRNAAGQNNWGQGLVLAEDQKEYVRAADEQRRAKKKDLMDDDFLPGILSGARAGGGGKIRVGAGRNVNSRRKH